MNTWTPLWSGIVDSSLWDEESDVCKVFMTLLAVKDSDHICRLDTYKIAKKCNFRNGDQSIDEVRVLDILKLLASPDNKRRLNQEFGGRRIKAVEGGWLVLNGEKYRQMVAEEMKQARWRKSSAAARKRKREKGSSPLEVERAYERAYVAGDVAEMDRLTNTQADQPAKE